MSPVDKQRVVAVFEEVARLLHLRGDDAFRARAYEMAAATLGQISDELFADLLAHKRLTELPSVGKGLEAQIEKLVATGSLPALEGLREELPPIVEAMAALPRLGIAKARRLHRELEIGSLEDLRAACRAGAVAAVKGFGPKTQDALLRALETLASTPSRPDDHEATKAPDTPLASALPLAERLRETLLLQEDVAAVDIVGALRRWHETVPAIELLVTLKARAVPDTPRLAPSWSPAAVLPVAPTGPADRGELGEFRGVLAGGIPLCLHFGTKETRAVRLFELTGSDFEVERLRAHARQQGLLLEHGALSQGQHPLSVGDERALYGRLRLPYRPPELREPEALEGLAGDALEPSLLKYEDVRGLIHCHTVHSDGKDTVLAMAQAADEIGMSYLTITDHSPEAHYARGVTLDRLKSQWDDIAAAQERVAVRILRGTESDITAEGALDYPDEILEQLDVVIASVHNRFKMDAATMTARLIRLMRLPVFKIWGHPLGRIIGNREPLACDVEAVLDAAAENGRTAIELNGDPHRLDLPPHWIRAARARHLPFVVSTDAHSTQAFGYLRFAVAMARRGGLSRSEVLNTADVETFRHRVRPGAHVSGA